MRSVSPPTARSAARPTTCGVPREFTRKLDKAVSGDCQGRVASGRALSARWLHRHQHGAAIRKCCRILEQTRRVRTVGQQGKGRDQMDAAVMALVRRQRRPPPASCARLQSREFPPHAGDARADQGLVADEPQRETHQDRREGFGHGRYVAFQMTEVAITRNL
jgi:hypothetical protein